MAAILSTLLPRLKNLPEFSNHQETTCRGGFLDAGLSDYDDIKKSQEDLKIFANIYCLFTAAQVILPRPNK